MGGKWIDTLLGEVIELKRGYDLPQRDRKPGRVALVSSSGVTDYQAELKVKGPGVVTGRYGTLGEVYFVREGFWPLNTTLYVCDFKGNDPRFIGYFLKGLNYSAYSDKAAVPGLNRNHLHQARIFFPTHVPEQRAIANVLGTLDDKIELNRRINETLEGMARALFQSWFGDFDPVRAKMDGEWRPGESLPGLPSDLYDLFSARLVASEIGEVPEGWEVVGLSDLIELNPTRSLSKGESAPYLPMASMPTTGHIPDAVEDREYGSGMRFTNGDTLMARITPCLENGKTAYVDFLEENQVGWGSTEYIVLRPKPPLSGYFAYCLARHEPFRQFAIRRMTGSSGRQRVKTGALEHYKLAFPRGAQIIEEFGELVSPLFLRAAAVAQESERLAGLRDTLLPKLISGELRVPDAERIVEQAS